MGSTRELWYRAAQSEGLKHSVRFLELCQQPPRERAYALITAGRLAITAMDHHRARRLLTEAAALAPAAGDAGIEPLACFLHGVSLFLAHELDEAGRFLNRALELYTGAGDGCGIGRSTATLGVVAFFRGDWPAATACLRQALALLTAAGDHWGQGLCHTYLGLTANAQIAHRLHLSHRTVENHIAHALAKLGARNRAELAARITDRPGG